MANVFVKFIRGERIRVGYKTLWLWSTDGYPYNLNTSTCKVGNSSVTQGKRWNKINKMKEIKKQHSRHINHEIYFDNFFESSDALVKLADESVKTIRTGR